MISCFCKIFSNPENIDGQSLDGIINRVKSNVSERAAQNGSFFHDNNTILPNVEFVANRQYRT